MPEPLDDIELMTRVREGDAEAFAMIVERHQHRVVGTIAKMLGSVTEAEDVAQQVFLRVWRSAPRWKPTAKFTTWLLTITRNLVFNEVRRQKRSRTSSLDEESEQNMPEREDVSVISPAQELANRELEQVIDAAIAELGEQSRMALILRRYEELPYEEIAEILGTTVPAVKSLLFRARTELRARLSAYLNESP
mgnify:CR=1 FL=1